MDAGTRILTAGLLTLVALGAPDLAAQTTDPRPATEQRGSDPPPQARPDAKRAESWGRLRVGMSQLEVLQILGEPGRTTRYYAFTRWEYPDALGRRVNFDEHDRLVAWGAGAR